MSYWSKQIIAREVELEKMRRAKPKVSDDIHQETNKQKEATAALEKKDLPNHLQRLVPKAVKPTKPSVVVS